MAKERPIVQRVKEEGGATVARQGLGEMPLTLWVIVAGIILFLYIRRAHLGIDTHPGERVQVKPKQPSVFIGPLRPPELPAPGQRGLGLEMPGPATQEGGILQ